MSDTGRPHGGAWAQASWLAAQTPEKRNRYVDFLRALSILVVVFGHWLMAAPFLEAGSPQLAHMLDVSPWTRWLTWVFQVMPVFFFVGGFSNRTSWLAAQRQATGYGPWLATRLRRLLGPVLPLIVAWAAMAAVAHSQGVGAGMIRVGSQVALVPVWFLAVYVMVVPLVPLTCAAWERLGWWSFWLPVAAAAAVDVAFFAGGLHSFGWLNYLFVWLAVHQLGYAWQDGRLSGVRLTLPMLLVGLSLLLVLVTVGPYPVSLVGVPSEEISNTLPPKLPLLALAVAQIGLLLALEGTARRWLARPTLWTSTVLVNGMIMTIFLWHSTVMMLLVGLGFWVLPQVLTPVPGTGIWWLCRPLWIAVFAAATLPFLAAFARYERPGRGPAPSPVAVWRLVSGCVIACLGLALLALDGVGGDGPLGLRVIPLLLPVAGAGLAGFGPLGRLARTVDWKSKRGS